MLENFEKLYMEMLNIYLSNDRTKLLLNYEK